jgi:nucleoside-diphosphate-sugar epimerase
MIFLILGSAGFLGSHLSFYLKAKGHEIISFDIIDSVD